MTLPPRTDTLERLAHYHPERIALESYADGRTWSYGELHRLACGLADHLRNSFGVQIGDRVAILARNTPFHVVLLCACQKAGWTMVPLNWRLSASELEYLARDADASLLIASDEFAQAARLLHAAHHADLDTLDETPSNDTFVPDRPITHEDNLLLLYTSGTTGRAKGAMVTHGMVFWNGVNTVQRLHLTADDLTFNAAPFYHTGGWNVLLTPFLQIGARTILLDAFDPDALLNLCEHRQITILWGVPTMLAMMRDSPRFAEATLASVRYAVVGGEAMPEPLIRTWQEKGVPIRQGFGMTEVGPNCFSLPEADALRKIGSIGLPNMYVETRVVDDEGRDVPMGTPGELLMGGPVVTSGYWRHSEATREAFDGPWFKTGDLVRVDDEGYFYVVGRKKDLFISGGENVYPAEVERVLVAHDDVVACAVVSAPHPRWGEVGVAYVVPASGATLTPDDLLALAREQLAGYKVPHHVRFVDALPTGHSGKVLKTDLRHRIRSELAALSA